MPHAHVRFRPIKLVWNATSLWAVLRSPVQRVSDHHRLRRRDHAVQKLVVDGLLHEYPPGGDAVLALVEEHSAHNALDGLVQVAVAEHDEGGLAAELERHLLQVRLGAGFHDGVANLSAAGESQFANLLMAGIVAIGPRITKKL